MKAIFRQILDAAPYDYPVHLSGATGTGKELVARAIHDHSARRRGAFVAVNCGAIPENLVESELFGHFIGAFSGAACSRKGRFEVADQGTLFLDEVDDLSTHIQIRLLRVLQCGRFEKVGGERSTSVDVRVISATNKPLKAEMNAGRFRQDLYYRLNVVPIHMPPLKAKRMGIPLLARHFLYLAATRYHRHPMAFTDRALAAMRNYDWPGNVRELQNVLRRSIATKNLHFMKLPGHTPVADKPGPVTDEGTDDLPLKDALIQYEKQIILKKLEQTRWNKSETARNLGVSRKTLFRKMKSCGLI
jgi:DNA-binding NtrC family response regulator